eukprot:4760160-Amphidinium_carterae.1
MVSILEHFSLRSSILCSDSKCPTDVVTVSGPADIEGQFSGLTRHISVSVADARRTRDHC